MPPDQKEMLFHAALHRMGFACFRKTVSEGDEAESLGSRAKAIFDTAP